MIELNLVLVLVGEIPSNEMMFDSFCLVNNAIDSLTGV